MTATALDLDRIAALKAEGFALRAGHHDASDGEGCAMDLIAWQTTGEITDMPSCVHPILSRLVHRINDATHTTAEGRWRIVTDAGPLLVGTDKWEGVRAAWVVANAGMTVGGLIDALRTGANLAEANLTGAYLARAYLAGANLARAKGNQWTVLPAGWTVADYGLVVRSDP